MAEKCPLCQGSLLNGECISCGYRPPDEADLSSLYNYDPSDYPQEELKMGELSVSPLMEESGLSEMNAPKAKVRSGAGKTPNAADPPEQENPSPNPYAANGTFKPYQSQSPQAVSGTRAVPDEQDYSQASLPVKIVKVTVNFVTAHWWKFLILMATPTAGMFIAGYYFVKFKANRRIADLLTAIMLGVLSVAALFNGWDPFGIDRVLQDTIWK